MRTIRRPPRAWRRRLTALLSLSVLIVAPGTRAAHAIGSIQTQTATAPEPVQISAITPWVDSDGEFQVRFAASPSVPPDAQLTYTIHQSLRAPSGRDLRDTVSAIIQGGKPGRVLQAPVTAPLSTFGAGEGGSLLSIPIRSRSSSDRTRAFLPGSGIHPVSIVLTAPDGPELWSTVVFLNHLPRDFGSAESTDRPLAVSLVTPVEVTPDYTTDRPTFSIRDRSELEALAALLQAASDSPLRVLLKADTVAALEHSEESWAEHTLDALREAFRSPSSESGGGTSGSSGPALLRSPFVASDTEAIAKAGGGEILRDQLTLGTQILSRISERPLVDATWALDEHIGPVSAPLIESLGFSDAIVSGSQLNLDDRRVADAVSRTPLRLAGSPNMTVTTVDDELSAYLADDSLPAANRAHEIISSLVADWFDANKRRDRSADPTAVIVVQPTVRAEAVATLGAALGGSGPLRGSDPTSILPPVTTSPGGASESTGSVSLRSPTPTDGVNEALAELGQTTHDLDAYGSAADAEPHLEFWELQNAASLAVSLSTSDVTRIHVSIRNQIAERIAQITPPASRRVVLGSRDTSIPLRFKNGLPYAVTLTLHARSPRLEITDGPVKKVVLEPGENRVDLPVVVRAPGESLLRLRLTTPEGDMDVASFDLPIRSTAISGVGAALSGISILFLLLWWFRTFRRSRRDMARRLTSHPSTSSQDDK